MLESLTPGARRALDRAVIRALRRGVKAVEPIDLLAALADEVESRAAVLMIRCGLEPDALFEALGVAPLPEAEQHQQSEAFSPNTGEAPNYSADLRRVLGDATMQARSTDR